MSSTSSGAMLKLKNVYCEGFLMLDEILNKGGPLDDSDLEIASTSS